MGRVNQNSGDRRAAADRPDRWSLSGREGERADDQIMASLTVAIAILVPFIASAALLLQAADGWPGRNVGEVKLILE